MEGQAWWKQALFVVAGLLSCISWRRSTTTACWSSPRFFYVLGLVLLLGVLLLGRQVFGSRRWIPLPGGFTFQVSEFVKLVIVLLAARYLSELRGDRPGVRDLLSLGVLVALPMALVMKQPDLGTALTYAAIAGAGMFFAGLRWQHAAVLAVSVRAGYAVGLDSPEGLPEGAPDVVPRSLAAIRAASATR